MNGRKFQWPEAWRKRRHITKRLTFSFRDFAIALVLFLLSSVLCYLLRQIDPNNDSSYVAVIFLLEVFLTAFLTDGYTFGVVTAVLSVLAVDYVFTAPYWEVSFVITGFPLTFLVMMFISAATSMITSRARKALPAAWVPLSSLLALLLSSAPACWLSARRTALCPRRLRSNP